MSIADPFFVMSILVVVALLDIGKPQSPRSNFQPSYPNLKRSKGNARSSNAWL